METIYLLFKNVKNGRIENNMYSEKDMPLYVQEVKSGFYKGFFVDIITNHVMSIDKGIVKYACIVNNDDLSIKTYYNNDCKLVKAPKNTFYSDAINF